MADEATQQVVETTSDGPQEAAAAQRIVLPGQTPEGEPVLSILVKRTYDIRPGQACTRAEEDAKLYPADVPYDGPVNSSVKYESDFVPFKQATDVVLNGKAYAPGGRQVEQLTVALTVEGQGSTLEVFGDREARYVTEKGGLFRKETSHVEFTEPKPFVEMDLVYERAYGGVDVRSDPNMACVYPRNHLGRGFVVEDKKEAVDGLELPNVEDPADLLTPERLVTGHFKDWEAQPMPAGFGWIAKFWRPRAELAGVMPADREVERQLREAYSELIPPEQKEQYEETALGDMDFRFFNGASAGLVFPFLTGGEEIRATNLTPDGDLVFRLPGPGERPGLGLDIGSGVQEPEVVLHTVMIRMEERQVDLVWRGAVGYPGPDWLPEMKKMEVMVR